MKWFTCQKKKIVSIISTALLVTAVTTHAQSSPQLDAIAINTANTASNTNVNSSINTNVIAMTAAIAPLGILAFVGQDWFDAVDKTSSYYTQFQAGQQVTASMQAYITNIVSSVPTAITAQTSMISTINAILNRTQSAITAPTDSTGKPFSLGTVTQATLLMGNDPSNPTYTGNFSNTTTTAQTMAQIFIQNASGSNFRVMLPSDTDPNNPTTLLGQFYNQVASVQSFSNYALSNLYAERVAGGTSTQPTPSALSQSMAFLNKLTGSTTGDNNNWIQQINTEDLGAVLRQNLIINAQNYVLLNNILEIQKQLLASQAMASSLNATGLYQALSMTLQSKH